MNTVAYTRPIAPETALSILETNMTEEGDCSQFDLVFAGGTEAVNVAINPTQMRAILAYLRGGN